MTYLKGTVKTTFRAAPDVVEWLRDEATRRGMSMNKLLNSLAREARDGIYTVFNEDGDEKKHVPPHWWQEDES